MRNTVLQHLNLEIGLDHSVKLSAHEAKLWRLSMNRVIKAIAPQFARWWPHSQIRLNLQLCGSLKIKKLNKMYRGKDKKTDVLSFQMHDNLRTTKRLPMPLTEFGDVYICREVAKAQAGSFKINEQQEWIHLAVHGILHLCGYDHEISSKEEKIMQKLESEILNKIAKIK